MGKGRERQSVTRGPSLTRLRFPFLPSSPVPHPPLVTPPSFPRVPKAVRGEDVTVGTTRADERNGTRPWGRNCRWTVINPAHGSVLRANSHSLGIFSRPPTYASLGSCTTSFHSRLHLLPTLTRHSLGKQRWRGTRRDRGAQWKQKWCYGSSPVLSPFPHHIPLLSFRPEDAATREERKGDVVRWKEGTGKNWRRWD